MKAVGKEPIICAFDDAMVYVTCKGKLFTWFSGDDHSRSRIDRFHLVDNIIDK